MNEPSNFCTSPCENLDQMTLSTDVVQTRFLSSRQDSGGSKKGLPGRNLTNPAYQIQNAIGLIGSKTARTDLIHQGGWTEYDTHNL
jgi:alpha-glucosidase